MHKRIQGKITRHYILGMQIFSSTFSLILCLQAGGDSSGVVTPSRQHPAGFAASAAAVCPESIWWAGTRTTKSGAAASQVPYCHLQVCIVDICWSIFWGNKISNKNNLIVLFWKESVQCRGDRHLLLYQSHHQHDYTLYSAGLYLLKISGVCQLFGLTEKYWKMYWFILTLCLAMF